MRALREFLGVWVVGILYTLLGLLAGWVVLTALGFAWFLLIFKLIEWLGYWR